VAELEAHRQQRGDRVMQGPRQRSAARQAERVTSVELGERLEQPIADRQRAQRDMRPAFGVGRGSGRSSFSNSMWTA